MLRQTTRPKKVKLPKLPQLLDRKIYKTGQTRGADDDEIYQNRVGRSSTVLIPYTCWKICAKPQENEDNYEHGFIVLLSPKDYFADPDIENILAIKGLELGNNALVFFETREDWVKYKTKHQKWKPAISRTCPLGGNYVARIPATTSTKEGDKIIHGFNTTKSKGAGIRVYEYASSDTISKCRLQLEALFWLCNDSMDIAVSNGMSLENAGTRRNDTLDKCNRADLLNIGILKKARILNANGKTICPLCLEELSSKGFFDKMAQAEGREVNDLTITQLNLFHISELRYGVLNHRPYNLGWGHHHCNVVVKDSGINNTLSWMKDIIDRNTQAGYLATEKRES